MMSKLATSSCFIGTTSIWSKQWYLQGRGWLTRCSNTHVEFVDRGDGAHQPGGCCRGDAGFDNMHPTILDPVGFAVGIGAFLAHAMGHITPQGP